MALNLKLMHRGHSNRIESFFNDKFVEKGKFF